MTVIYVIVALITGFSLFDYYINRNWEAITSVSRNEAVFHIAIANMVHMYYAAVTTNA
jgi:hypothetical protein